MTRLPFFPEPSVAPAPEPTTLPDGPLTEDTPCVRCRYNLRGLEPDACCPECALPIVYSLGPQSLVPLSADDPAWHAALARGAALLVWAAWLVGATVVAGSALLWAHYQFGLHPGTGRPRLALGTFDVGANLSALLLAAGIWYWTAAPMFESRRAGLRRRCARWLMLLTLLGPVFVDVGSQLANFDARLALMGILFLLAGPTAAVALVMLAWHAAHVAARDNRSDLARNLEKAGTAVALTWALCGPATLGWRGGFACAVLPLVALSLPLILLAIWIVFAAPTEMRRRLRDLAARRV